MKLNNIFMPCWEEIALAMEDRDEKIGYWCQMLESLGRAGIPCLGWEFQTDGQFPNAFGYGARRGGHTAHLTTTTSRRTARHHAIRPFRKTRCGRIWRRFYTR